LALFQLREYGFRDVLLDEVAPPTEAAAPARALRCTDVQVRRHVRGYCGIGGTGVSCPVGVARTDG
jgi:hypothetical protein